MGFCTPSGISEGMSENWNKCFLLPVPFLGRQLCLVLEFSSVMVNSHLSLCVIIEPKRFNIDYYNALNHYRQSLFNRKYSKSMKNVEAIQADQAMIIFVFIFLLHLKFVIFFHCQWLAERAHSEHWCVKNCFQRLSVSPRFLDTIWKVPPPADNHKHSVELATLATHGPLPDARWVVPEHNLDVIAKWFSLVPGSLIFFDFSSF